MGALSAQKSRLYGYEMETRALLGGTEENSFPDKGSLIFSHKAELVARPDSDSELLATDRSLA